MTRENFIKKLTFRLRWHFDENEVAEIISDYNEYFEVGASKGESEQRLIEEFGTPREIATTLALGWKTFLKQNFKFVTHIVGIMLVTLLMVTSGYWARPIEQEIYSFRNALGNGGWVSIFCAIATPIAVLVLLKCQWKKEPLRVVGAKKYVTPILLAMIILSVFLFIVSFLVYLFIDVLKYYISFDILVFCEIPLMRIIQFISILAWGLSTFYMRNISEYFIATHFLLTGIVWSGLNLIATGSWIPEYGYNLWFVPHQLIPLIIGIMLAIATAVVLRHKKSEV